MSDDCTCACTPEEHGPNGCKTWFGDKNTGFRCNCGFGRDLEAEHQARVEANRKRTAEVGDDCDEPGCGNVSCVFSVHDPLPEGWTRTVVSAPPASPRVRLRCPDHPLPPGGIVSIGGKIVNQDEKPLRSTHQDRLALDCGRLIIEMLQQKEAAGVGIRGLIFGWSHEELRQEIAQIILKNGFEKL